MFDKKIPILQDYTFKPDDHMPLLNGITKKAIDGDLHDARFIDEKDCFILLDPKGKDTLKDTTGFVRELN